MGDQANTARPSNPLIVSFTIDKGEIWIDPDGVSWEVDFTDLDKVYFSRRDARSENAVLVVQKWRKFEPAEECGDRF